MLHINAGSAAAPAFETLPTAPDVVCDAEGAACFNLELDTPPTITERDLGIGHFAIENRSGEELAERETETVLDRSPGEARKETPPSEKGGTVEGVASTDSFGEGTTEMLSGEVLEGGTETSVEGVGAPSSVASEDSTERQVQLVRKPDGAEADDSFCGGRKDSGRGQCQWEGDALRFPSWAADGWALLCTLVPESELRRIAELGPGDESTDEPADGSADVPLGQELQVLDSAPSTRPPRVAPIGLDEYRKAALQQQGKEEHTQNASEAASGAATPPPPKRVHPEGPRFNYASVTAGAKVVGANKEAKGQGNVLDEDKDKYLRNPCSVDDQWVVIELTQDTRIDTVVLSNFEFYSSGPKDFALFGSQSYPNDGEWAPLGEFTAQNVRTPQSFELSAGAQGAWVRYLLVRLLSHYGAEFYCTLSLIRVHGTDALESFREELVEAMRETGAGALTVSEVVKGDGQGGGEQAGAHEIILVGDMGGAASQADKVGSGTEAAVVSRGFEADGMDELLRTPAELDAAQKKDGASESEGVVGNPEGGPGTKSVAVSAAAKAVAPAETGATMDESAATEEGLRSSNASESGNGTLGSSPPVPDKAALGLSSKDGPAATANTTRTEEPKSSCNETEKVVRPESRGSPSSITPASSNQTTPPAGSPTSALPLAVAPTTSGQASASVAAAGNGRPGAGSGNGRQGGDFVLKVLLQRLKALEANASLFEGYVSETQAQLSRSLNDLDGEVEALAGRLNATTGMAAKMWARLQAVVRDRGSLSRVQISASGSNDRFPMDLHGPSETHLETTLTFAEVPRESLKRGSGAFKHSLCLLAG